MRIFLAFLAAALAAGCSPGDRRAQASSPPGPAPLERNAQGFPRPDRPVAGIVASEWSSGPSRDAADESGQLIRGLGIAPGMAVADIGAGSGYHTLRLAPAVGAHGVVYAEDIVAAYLSGLKREAERRGLKNVKIVVGTADDPKLPRHAVDRAVLVHMYHEIENPYALLWNLASALKPGAQVGVIDVDRPTNRHGTPPSLLKCEFEAVGYREIGAATLTGGVGYLAIFEAPAQGARPKPADIRPCKAPPAD
jgi:SAM-dependent methyltransferase